MHQNFKKQFKFVSNINLILKMQYTNMAELVHQPQQRINPNSQSSSNRQGSKSINYQQTHDYANQVMQMNKQKNYVQGVKQVAVKGATGRKGSLPSSYNQQSQSQNQQKNKLVSGGGQVQYIQQAHNNHEPQQNKGTMKLIKSHAKYFSQQNSPVSKQKRLYHQQQSSQGAIADVQVARQNQQSQNTRGQSSYSNQNQQKGTANFGTNSHQGSGQGQDSSQRRFNHNNSQLSSNVYRKQQLPSKFTNSTNMLENEPSAFANQGRLSVSSINNMQQPATQAPQPTQHYIKQYHSINQGPVISSAACNQTVATGQSLHTMMGQSLGSHHSNQTYQSLASQSQTLQNSQNINRKKLKQKYDDNFLNDHIQVQNQNTQDINFADQSQSIVVQNQRGNHNKRHYHNQSQIVGQYDQRYDGATIQVQQSMKQAQMQQTHHRKSSQPQLTQQQIRASTSIGQHPGNHHMKLINNPDGSIPQHNYKASGSQSKNLTQVGLKTIKRTQKAQTRPDSNHKQKKSSHLLQNMAGMNPQSSQQTLQVQTFDLQSQKRKNAAGPHQQVNVSVELQGNGKKYKKQPSVSSQQQVPISQNQNHQYHYAEVSNLYQHNNNEVQQQQQNQMMTKGYQHQNSSLSLTNQHSQILSKQQIQQMNSLASFENREGSKSAMLQAPLTIQHQNTKMQQIQQNDGAIINNLMTNEASSGDKKDPLTFSMKKQSFRERAGMTQSGKGVQERRKSGHQVASVAIAINQNRAIIGGNPKIQNNQYMAESASNPTSATNNQAQLRVQSMKLSSKYSNSKSQKSSTSRLASGYAVGSKKTIEQSKHQQTTKMGNSNTIGGSTDRLNRGVHDQNSKMNYPMNSNNVNQKSSTSTRRSGNQAQNGKTTYSQSRKALQMIGENVPGSAYPYQSTSTKSGGGQIVIQQRKQSHQQIGKQDVSINQIFEQKGLNYLNPNKVSEGQNVQKVKHRINHNGIIVQTKGQQMKQSHTTSANTAVNTAQNSPRIIMNQNALFNKNKQQLINVQKRKSSAASLSESNQLFKQSSDPHDRNQYDESQIQVTEEAIEGGCMPDQSVNMTMLRQEMIGRKITDQEFQSQNQQMHGIQNFIEQKSMLQGSKMSHQYNQQNQFIDGGTGSNPDLIQHQRQRSQGVASNVQGTREFPGRPDDRSNTRQNYHNEISPDYRKQSINKPQQYKQPSSSQVIRKQKDKFTTDMRMDILLKDEVEYQDYMDDEILQQHLPEGPLITEEEEQEIRQVASDINEKAFYGKILKTKQIIKDYKGKGGLNSDANYRKLSPRSQEIAFVMDKLEKSFRTKNEAPETILDFYRIGKMLGRGAFGKVNLAMHKLVRKLVALKSLNKECLTDEAQKTKLMKEVNLLLKLRHDNVVKIYETIETKKHIIIVMELCAGGDLLNYVRKRRRLKEPFAKKIFKQIIDGLAYIHSKYIGHRDIKLDNILLDGKGQVKIADFGVSKQCQPGVKMREQCGTPAYIAPEILRNKNGYSFNVDLWSAGVVLFAMLYGTVPFKAATMDELHSLILRGVYTLKDDISEEARDMLRGLLEINPHKRLNTQQILEHPWLADYDESLQLFNDQEREMIKKEYTYNDPSRYNRNENEEEPIDCFTEHNIDSVYNTMKNCSEKSIILAPFNSTQSEDMELFKKQIKGQMREKNQVMRLSRLCREIDRQYEFNNNGQLDNGVYHKQINNTQEDKSEALSSGDEDLKGKKPKKKKENKSDDEEEDESRFQVMQCSKSHGQEFLTEDYVDDQVIRKNLKDPYHLANMTEAERQLIESTFGTNREMEIDEYKVDKLKQYGYPKEYILKSLQDNEPNYLTAGYYLLKMDQNYC